VQFRLQLATARCSHAEPGAGPRDAELPGGGFLPGPADDLVPRDRRHVVWRPWNPWTPLATPPGIAPVPRLAPPSRSAGCWRIWSSGWSSWTGCTARSRRMPKPWRTPPLPPLRIATAPAPVLGLARSTQSALPRPSWGERVHGAQAAQATPARSPQGRCSHPDHRRAPGTVPRGSRGSRPRPGARYCATGTNP
jgi:hypothetical protein